MLFMRDLLPFRRLPTAIASEVMGRRKFILNSTEIHEWCSYVRSVKHDSPAAVSARVLITPPCMKPCCWVMRSLYGRDIWTSPCSTLSSFAPSSTRILCFVNTYRANLIPTLYIIFIFIKIWKIFYLNLHIFIEKIVSFFPKKFSKQSIYINQK